MNVNVARHVIRVAFRSEQELTDLMQLLKTQLSADEYKDFALGIAAAIDAINVR